MTGLRLVFLIFCVVLKAQESPISMSIADMLYFSDKGELINEVTLEIQNNTQNKYILPIDFDSFNLMADELKEYKKDTLFHNQDYVYPWLNIADSDENPVYFYTVFEYIGNQSPYFHPPLIKNEDFYKDAFKYSLIKLDAGEKITFMFYLSLPSPVNGLSYYNSTDLLVNKEYKLWFELFVSEKHYKQYLTPDYIELLRNEGYILFQGLLSTDSVPLRGL